VEGLRYHMFSKSGGEILNDSLFARKVLYQKTGVLTDTNGVGLRGQFTCNSNRSFSATVLFMMRAAIYARVSTKDGRQDTDNQLRQLRAFAATQGWAVVHEYVDRASGKRGDREQFQRMFAAASRREFDCLLFWSLDRLSWEGTAQTLSHLERLNGYGVNYRSFTEQYLDSTGMFKEAVIGILAAVAKQERVRLSERTIAGLERAKAQGRIGGRPKAEDSEPWLVANIARLRSHGHSIRAIAAEVGKSANTVIRLLKTSAGKAA